MKPTARTCHATRTLLELAHHGQHEPMRASTLCVRLGISSKLLEKIVRPLKEAGLVKSVRGATGGYMLAQPPADISLGRVLCVMEGAVFTPQCCESDTDCQLMGGCPTGRVWIEISRAIEESFNATTLAGLMATPKAGCPGETARANARAAASQNPSLHDGAEPAGPKLVRRKRPRPLSFVPRLSGPRHSGRSRFSAEKLTK
jgi:Rrf2 family protein